MGKQDIIYNGDVSKWARFANSLKLKIAVRLLHADKAKHSELLERRTNSAGFDDLIDHDFIYNVGSKNYHFDDGINPGVITKHLSEFLVENKELDAFVFFFQKNDYNSMVFQF